ncbi:MAG TPA: hypothetical protein VGG17_03355 [Acidimicrobiales bacterium]
MSGRSAASASTNVERRELAVLRRMTLGTVCIILVQSGIGMAANLYVTVPRHHSGARPTDYFTGSARSIGWAMSSAAIILTIHAILGFALVVMVFNTVIRLLTLKRGSVNAWAILGALFVIGAGFNGASFLDFGKNISSLLMSLLALASILCYVLVLFLTSVTSNSTLSTQTTYSP